MKILNILLVVALSTTILSCREHQIEGRGATGTDARSIAATFSHIEIDAPVNAHISLAPGGNTITLSGYANLLKHIKTEVRDSILHIYVSKLVDLHTDRNIEATITCASLTSLSVSGTGAAKVSGVITASAFSCETSGVAGITIENLKADVLAVDASGASTISITSGSTRSAAYDVSGTSKVAAYGLESADVSIDGSGTSNTDIAATTSLTVSASGTARIRYKGDPKVTTDVSGMATISKADGTAIPVNRHAADDDDDNDSNDDDTSARSW